jgi:hypothetical protein
MFGVDGCVKSRPHRHAIPGPSNPQRVAVPTTVSRPTEIFDTLLLLLTLGRNECCKPKLWRVCCHISDWWRLCTKCSSSTALPEVRSAMVARFCCILSYCRSSWTYYADMDFLDDCSTAFWRDLYYAGRDIQYVLENRVQVMGIRLLTAVLLSTRCLSSDCNCPLS